jgi:hypothetical protein
MANGSFFKGEKKKKKKGQGNQTFSVAPVFVPPAVIRKDVER